MKAFLCFLFVIFFLSHANVFADEPLTTDELNFYFIQNNNNQNVTVTLTLVSQYCWDQNFNLTNAFN
jgi:hypothetical protein